MLRGALRDFATTHHDEIESLAAAYLGHRDELDEVIGANSSNAGRCLLSRPVLRARGRGNPTVASARSYGASARGPLLEWRNARLPLQSLSTIRATSNDG